MEQKTKDDMDIYPLTIIRDRYCSPDYLAFNLEAWDVPRAINDDGLDYDDFWTYEASNYIIGKGESPQEALADLKAKLQPAPDHPCIDKFLFLDLEGVMEYGRLVSIQNLQFILEQTHCKVIITSPCRHHGSEWVKQLWQGYDMPGQYDSMTPILSDTTYKDPITGDSLTFKGFGYRATTSLEIGAWLNAHATQDFTYAILDLSDNFHLKQQEHLVVIDKFKGLTRVNASKAISILNGSV